MSTGWVTDAVTGGDSASNAMLDAIGKAATKISELATEMESARETDTARWTALNEERKAQAVLLEEMRGKFDAIRREEETREAIAAAAELRAMAAQTRASSKAGVIAGGRGFTAYEPGSFLGAIADLQSRDPDRYAAGKATLEAVSRRQDATGKATIGDTDATGGWILPNAIVDQLIKPAMVANIYRDVMTVVSGVTTSQVDMPYRADAPARAIVAAWGSEKQNVSLTYNGYSASLYTLARVMDASNQFLTKSRGAAEQDILEEMAHAFALGESYYIREGSGSSEPYGYTGALTNGPAAYRSSFSPSATTLAGSISAAIATAAGALAGRGSQATGAVMTAAAYYTMLSQGTDSAGFFFAPANGPTAIRPGTLVTAFGVPVYPDAAADRQGTAAVTDNLVVAEWRRFKIYTGAAYRVDSSSVAGTRWDYNLTGFRGEMELGFDARPAVYSGHAQLITDILP